MKKSHTTWVAGIMEGEGWFGFRRHKGVTKAIGVTVCMTDEDVVRRLHEIVGAGQVYSRKPAKEGWKPAWQWVLTNRPEVIQFISELRPWMGSRRSARIDEMLAYDAENPVLPRYRHGSISEWNRGCRCDTCADSHERHKAARRVTSPKRKPPQHGTNSKYTQGCRCQECRDAHSKYQRNYTSKRRSNNNVVQES